MDEQVKAIMESDVPGWALPHPTILTQFVRWVVWEDGCDENGAFIGYCPLHDGGVAFAGSAEFNFSKGMMRCCAEPSCLAPKRAISIQNLMERMNRVSND